MVFALVEVRACFLSGGQRDSQLLSVFIDDDGFRQRLSDHLLPELEAFEFPHPAIISEKDGTRVIAFGEQFGD
jgi:hypothetical protein